MSRRVNLLPAKYILDLFPGAAFAFSFAKLWSLAIWCCRIRRSSDNDERDIGFDSNGNFDAATALAFCGDGNGFVVGRYGQGGSVLNETQPTANLQPQIIASGVLITEGSRAAMDTLGTRRLILPGGIITGNTNRSSFSIQKLASTAATATAGNLYSLYNPISDATPGHLWNVGLETAALAVRINGSATWLYPAGKSALTHSIISTIHTGTNVNGIQNWQNGTTMAFNSGTGAAVNTADTFPGAVGLSSSGQIANGKFQELIIYASDQSANRAVIEESRKQYYGIT